MNEKLAKARVKALYALPYLARIAFSVRHVLAPVGTACVSESWVLCLDPAFVERLRPEELAFVLAHEYLHLLLEHARRRGERDPERWNIAADIVINEMLCAGFPTLRPPSGEYALVRGSFFGIYNAEELTAEEVYARLPEDARAGEGVGQGRCGSGAGGERLPGEVAEGGRPAPEREAVAQAAQREAKGIGRLPGGLSRELGAAERSRVDWRRALRALVRGSLAHALGKGDYTFKRPSRRTDEVVLPSLLAPRPRACVVVDTSGSMGAKELAQAVAEVEALLRELAEVEVLACDAAVHARARVTKRADIPALLRGGGGTDMGQGVREATRSRPDLVVVITDGYTPWPKERPPVPVVVCLVGDGPEPPAWARCVRAV